MKTRLQNSIGKFRAPSKSVAICAAIASTLALLAIPAQAQKITYTVENHSFEDPVLPEPGYRNSPGYAFTIASWTRGDYRRGTAVAYFPNQSNFKAPPNGIDWNNVFSTSGAAVGVQAWVTQDVSGATLLAEAGRKYTLTVAAGKYLDIGPGGLSVRLAIGTTSMSFGKSLAIATYTPDLLPSGSLSDFSVTYTSTGSEAQIGETLKVWVLAEQQVSPADVSRNTAFDNVRFSSQK